MQQQMLPATPGFYLIKRWPAGTDERQYTRDPIIAWMLTDVGAIEPVTVNGVGWPDTRHATALLLPEGCVRTRNGSTLSGPAEWLNSTEQV